MGPDAKGISKIGWYVLGNPNYNIDTIKQGEGEKKGRWIMEEKQ